MTLSIIAADQPAGTVGAAVTSCAIAAGRRILHVRPSVGAAVAQGSSEITWGEDILDALERRVPPNDAIARFAFEESQVAAISFDGELAVHSGTGCAAYVEHRTEGGVSCQVNTAEFPDGASRMLQAFTATEGPLAERLVAALAASGGDARGQQAAAVIVTGQGPLRGYEDEPHVDLRVDDHRDPVGELGRLLALHRAHCIMRSLDRRAGVDNVAVLQQLLALHPGDPQLQRALARTMQSR